MIQTFKGKLIAAKLDVYSIYVFQNLETLEYIMCTKLPNWQTLFINIGDIGFVEIQTVKAGEEYFNLETQTVSKYQYSNVYFINFILEPNINNNQIIL